MAIPASARILTVVVGAALFLCSRAVDVPFATCSTTDALGKFCSVESDTLHYKSQRKTPYLFASVRDIKLVLAKLPSCPAVRLHAVSEQEHVEQAYD